MKYKKKLIEVALPLEAINVASSNEKTVKHGHPASLHLWWARRPLAAARAVIFSQMVDDPSEHPDIFKTLKDQDKERKRLFKIIEDLVKWENTTNEDVLKRANQEIWQSWRHTCAANADHPKASDLFNRKLLPSFHDPFAGGGALPLEAQRLGLESYATDLNPVAVLINKAMIEIPPRFSGFAPVNPAASRGNDLAGRVWTGAQGLAEDITYYGNWIREEAQKKIGDLYPKIEITTLMAQNRPDLKKYIGQRLTVISWIWARTVASPNPAFTEVNVPLATTFLLSTKLGKEVYLEPIVGSGTYTFKVRVGRPQNYEEAKAGTKISRGANFKCLISNSPIDSEYIKSEGKAGRIGSKLMAIVVEGNRERVYLDPCTEQENIAKSACSEWRPEVQISGSTQYLGVKPYGIERFDQIFTERQLVALTTFSDLISEVRILIRSDALMSNLSNDGIPLDESGSGATAYADAVAMYLSFALNKQADLGSNLCAWEPIAQCPRHIFGRQAIPMVWDFAEGNPLGASSGSWVVFVSGISKAFAKAFQYVPKNAIGFAGQADAGRQTTSLNKVISTDPPYYDNVPYADLSDFFYVWMRRALRGVFKELFTTVVVPKAEELVAFGYRHKNGKVGAEEFFLNGMTEAMRRLAEQAHPAFPVTIYYAFKQTENDNLEGTASTGWETFLDAVIRAGFAITGTWPMRTENKSRLRGQSSNALASSIILVCRPRSLDAEIISRRNFISALKAELPEALSNLQAGNIAPVDLAQASIGPGMSVFSRYGMVLDADGKPLSVRAALVLINQTLDETLEQQGDFDEESLWALTWFDQNGFGEGDFGVASILAQAKNTGMDKLAGRGIISSGKGKVRLLQPIQLNENWNLVDIDYELSSWEIVHQLIRILESKGEEEASKYINQLDSKAEIARELCYRLYSICERRKRANEAMSYNGLVQSWPELLRLSRDTPLASNSENHDLFDQE